MLVNIFIAHSLCDPINITKDGLNYTLHENHTATLCGFTTTDFDDLEIPSIINNNNENYTVTVIGENAMYGSYIHGKLTLPPTIVYIKNNAFWKTLKGLSELSIPDSVIELGAGAFKETNIISLTFGKNVATIGDACFYITLFLNADLTLPSSLKKIGAGAFASSALKTVKGGSLVTEYGSSCFALSPVTHIDLSQSITSIPDYFAASTNLEGCLEIPQKVTSIWMFSFMQTKITDILIPSTLTEIGTGAFLFCVYLSTHLTFQQYVKIDEGAFEATAITGLFFCYSYIGKKAFASCKKLTGEVYIEKEPRLNDAPIGEEIFIGCSEISSFNLNNLKIIPKSFAEGCTSLEFVSFTYDDGFTILEEIGEQSFSMCSSLKSIKYPNTIKKIGSKAFFCCSSYSGILDLSNYPNLEEIGDEAFLGCSSLVGELSFPSSLTTIGSKAFVSCKFSGSIIIPNNVIHIGKYAFFSCTDFNGKIVIGNGCTAIEESVFGQCKGLTGSIHIGSAVTEIGPCAFFGCESLTGNLEIPSSVTSIGESAFTNCRSLSGSLLLNEGLISIGDHAFSECVNLSGSLVFPSSLRSIGNMTFFKCVGIIDVTFKSNNVSVGFMAFSKMQNKCFSNVPDGFADDVDKYSKDNFTGSMLPASFLNMHCSLFYGIDTFLVVLTSVLGSAGFIAAAQFIWVWWSARSANIANMTVAFREIIAEIKKEYDGDYKDSTFKIINKVQDRLLKESEYYKFNTTRGEAESALNDAIKEEWPTLLPSLKENITQKSLDDIKFRKPCKCSKCKKENKSDNEDELTGTLLV